MIIGQCLHRGSKIVFTKIDNNFYLFNNKIKSTIDLISYCNKQKSLSEIILQNIDSGSAIMKIQSLEEFNNSDYTILRPIDPPEAWAVGVTYHRQAIEHDKDINEKLGKNEQLYNYVYENERAEVFFKGLSRTIVGHDEALWLRPDSKLIMPEGELVLVIGKEGLPIAYTLGNDLTAWDIESECPLYLNQAKIWNGSGSIGPYMIPVEMINDPYDITINCCVTRNGKTVVNSHGNTSGLKRSLEELCYYLNFSNDVTLGSVLFTGTTCVIDHNFSLAKGDIVVIKSPTFGNLRNEIHVHDFPEKNFSLR